MPTASPTPPTTEGRYEAVRSRDARFDGEFFFAVSTTGIYCRPSCPATTPKRENVSFYPSAAAAQAAGYRACRRCRPDAVPGSAAWNARADMVGRAMRLISDGVVDEEGVPGLARRLGYSARQVQRQLVAEVGAGPLALARAQRAHAARVLLQTTGLSAADIAFAAGFASIRQFNDTIREVYAATPTQLRRHAPATPPTSVLAAPASALEPAQNPTSTPVATTERPQNPAPSPPSAPPSGGIPLRLAYRGTYASAQVFDYLQCHAVAGVEEITGAPGRRVYRRTLRLTHGAGIAQVNERPGGASWLDCVLDLDDLRDFTAAIGRVRRLFDLDADPYAVAESFADDPLLAPLCAAAPGLRAPGAADPAELALVTALTSTSAQLPDDSARRQIHALVTDYGDPLPTPRGGLTHLFPTPQALADADIAPAARALARALADGTVRLDVGADRDAAEQALRAVPGLTPWAAGYIRMRALGDPDVLLDDDPVLSAARTADGASPSPDTWRPWRSYAMHYLWDRHAARRPTSPAPTDRP
jgi:AraC family transcriptional regulator of adaptative response / DNA-3-methyladenine glycosylase II